MSRTVWKYPLELTVPGTFVLKMPVCAEILTAQFQHCGPCLWALVDPEAKQERRKIIAVWTGREIGLPFIDGDEYIATIQDPATNLVWHLFDMGVA